MEPDIGHVLKKASARPEAPPDFARLIRRAQQSRRRRRAALVGGPVCVLALVLTALAVFAPPWVGGNRVTKLNVLGHPTASTPSRSPSPTSAAVPIAVPAGTPSCQAPSLRADAGWLGGLQLPVSSTVGAINVTNVGTSPCFLQGQPRLRFVGETGSVFNVEEPPADTGLGEPNRFGYPVLLQPGAIAYAQVHWLTWCGSHSGSATVQILLAGQPALQVVSPIPTIPPCLDANYPSTVLVTDYYSNAMLAMPAESPPPTSGTPSARPARPSASRSTAPTTSSPAATRCAIWEYPWGGSAASA